MPNEITPKEAAENISDMADVAKISQRIYTKTGDPEILRYAASVLRKLSTGEIREVVHSKWVPAAYKPEIYDKCPICHARKDNTDYFNFCPNCGADMRKDGAENASKNPE